MRYPVSEKLEIIRLVEGSHLSARLTLAKLGIPRTTFYRWYDRYLQRGEAGLQDQSPKPKHVWNRIPDEVRRKVVKLALKETELSPRELAVTFTDRESYFVSEASTYRILKAHDLITSPAFICITVHPTIGITFFHSFLVFITIHLATTILFCSRSQFRHGLWIHVIVY